MSRGQKLDLFIGADIEAGWSEIQEASTHPDAEMLEPSKHRLVFKKEKRRGKTVTLVGPFQLGDADAKRVLAKVKKQLGSGGSYRAPWMEFQGECRDRLNVLLETEGFGFKKK